MSVLGIIPARGGSKRIPRKNIRLLAGKPLINYTIEAALGAKCLDRFIVSTDDDEIAEVAKRCGAEVPFRRPAELAEDGTPDQPVFRHALEELKELSKYEPEIVLNLRPTTPLKTSKTIDKVIETIIETKADIVRTMSPVTGVNHPYWMYKLSENDQAVPFVNDIRMGQYFQRQLLPPVYRINCAADAMKSRLIYEGNIFGDNSDMRIVITSQEESIDIDTEFDFKLCEFLVNMKRSNFDGHPKPSL